MPVFLNNNGTPQDYDVFINQGGVAVPCEVYQKNGVTNDIIYLPILVVDDFESGNLNNWNIPSQTGTVVITNNDSDVWEGSYAIQLKVDGYTEAWADDTSLEYVPQPGDKWEFYTQFNTFSNNQAQARFYFGLQGNQNNGDQNNDGGYVIELYKDGTFRLQRNNANGTYTTIAQSAEAYNINYSTNQDYKIVHYWEHPDKARDHVLELRNADTDNLIVSVSGDDTTFGAGGIGLIFNEYAGGMVDYINIADRTA